MHTLLPLHCAELTYPLRYSHMAACLPAYKHTYLIWHMHKLHPQCQPPSAEHGTRYTKVKCYSRVRSQVLQPSIEHGTRSLQPSTLTGTSVCLGVLSHHYPTILNPRAPLHGGLDPKTLNPRAPLQGGHYPKTLNPRAPLHGGHYPNT